MDVGFDGSYLKRAYLPHWDRLSRVELAISCWFEALKVVDSHFCNVHADDSMVRLLNLHEELAGLDVDRAAHVGGRGASVARKARVLFTARMDAAFEKLDQCNALISAVLDFLYTCVFHVF